MPLKKIEDKKPGGFDSTQQKGNIVKAKLKSQKELKKITSSDEYKKADYQGKTKMLNVATHLTGGQAKLDKNKNNRIDAEDFKILRGSKKPMKAVLGALALGAAGAMGAKKLMKKKSGVATPGVGAAAAIAKKKKEILGRKKGGMFKGYSKVFETAARAGQKNTGTSTIVGVKPNPKKSLAKSKRKTYKSMAEMRAAKGFKPGESAADFNKRKANEAFAKRAAKATGARGKIALGVAAAGVSAYQYLKSKMKKKDKKMGGGMMQKYSVGGNVLHKLKSQKELKKITDSDAYKKADYKGKTEMLGGKVTTGKEMQKKAEGGPVSRSAMAEQQRRMGQRKKKPGATGRPKQGPAGGLGNLPGKKERPHIILRTMVPEGPAKRYRTMKDFEIYKNQIDGMNIKNVSNKSVGGSVTVKTKLGRNKPTKMY